MDLAHASFDALAGVYVIWHGGQNPRWVRVGKGMIRDRLTAHRADSAVLAYGKFGTLFVSWAEVPTACRDGVESFLAESLKPLVGDRFPDCDPIPVNLPK